MITIKLNVKWQHGTNPRQNVIDTLRQLLSDIEKSTPDSPAIGGDILVEQDDDDFIKLGSYTVEFG